MSLWFSIIIYLSSVGILILGYLIGFKYNYKLITGYQFRSDTDRYPRDIEKKYCRYIGAGAIVMGLSMALIPTIASRFPEISPAYIILTQFCIVVYLFTVPTYIVKKEFKKYRDNKKINSDKN